MALGKGLNAQDSQAKKAAISVGILRFPGSNCDEDALRAVQQIPQFHVQYHWHDEPLHPHQYQLILIPGGFSFGDYIRTGAIAKLSPCMQGLLAAVEAGAHAIGICNGFQILIEAGLLPGFLKMNLKGRFISETVPLQVTGEAYPWIRAQDKGLTLRFPIAHGFGNYQYLSKQKNEAKSVLKYLQNPNGSVESIAGIYRKVGEGSFFGLMPHPERASFDDLGLSDGMLFWKNAAEELSV